MRALLSLMLLFLAATGPAAAEEHKRVMILHSFGRDFRPWGEYARTIRAQLTRQSPFQLDISDHSLVAARSSDENPEPPFIEYLNALGVKYPPDLIICIGAPAAGFVLRHRSRLFPRTPAILAAIEQRRVDVASLTENDTVVAVSHDYQALFDNILRVLPNTRNVLIINGVSPNERFWLDELRRVLKPYEGRLTLLWSAGMPFTTVLKNAAALPANTAIFWHLMNVDAAGVAHEGDTGLRELYAVANAPIFSYDDGFFGQEVVGGPMNSVTEVSQKTVAAAIRLLSGEKAGDIKIPATNFAAPKYDWRLLQRWGINEALLPPGSKVYFREPSAWERYRWQIIVICAGFLAQAALISLLSYERRRRQLAEVQSRQRMSELAHSNRYSMAGELTASIAHEINQPLGSILTNAESAQLILKSPTPDLQELQEILSDIQRDDQRASEVIKRLRSLLKKAPFELKNLDVNDLVAEAVELLSGAVSAREVGLRTFLASIRLPVKGDRIQLQQVIINLVINAMDAVSAMPVAQRKISVSTVRIDDMAEVSISDSGPGIPTENLKQIFEPFFTTKPQGMGMGLSIARTIVEANNGQLSAENGGNGGAVFRLSLPIVDATGDLSGGATRTPDTIPCPHCNPQTAPCGSPGLS
jgi:signal transduction histidine kinase